ncbi:MAG: class I SAM-dependent methyltransferase [Povalibacter sp.]
MADQEQNDIVETLLLPFENHLDWPGTALFLRARDGIALHRRELSGLVCEQTFKPHADELSHAGLSVERQVERTFPQVLVLPPRQREESRALLARALKLTAPGGLIAACQHNNEGARSMETDLAQLSGPVSTLSKHRCRVAWTAPLNGPADAQLFEQWLALDAPRPIAGGSFISRPGLFAWDRIDPASLLLAAHLPRDLSGRAADLGAGFGFLSAELLTRCPKISSLDLYEAEARALDLAKQNLKPFEARITPSYHWHDVGSGLDQTYDVIVTNPPFHTSDRLDRPDIGRRFISVAAQSLRSRGRLWLVANRHLPYEDILNESFGEVRQVATERGYKVIEAIKGSDAKAAPTRDRKFRLQRF